MHYGRHLFISELDTQGTKSSKLALACMYSSIIPVKLNLFRKGDNASIYLSTIPVLFQYCLICSERGGLQVSIQVLSQYYPISAQ